MFRMMLSIALLACTGDYWGWASHSVLEYALKVLKNDIVPNFDNLVQSLLLVLNVSIFRLFQMSRSPKVIKTVIWWIRQWAPIWSMFARIFQSSYNHHFPRQLWHRRIWIIFRRIQRHFTFLKDCRMPSTIYFCWIYDFCYCIQHQ
jgi:hypothetical protein